MSTHKRHGLSRLSHVAYAKQFIVQKEQDVETLGDFVRRVRTEQRLSLADVQARAKRAGHEIGTTHINRIENGFIEAASVTPKKLIALAAGLGISEDEIFAVARGKSISGDLQLDESRLLEYFRVLPQDSRDVLLAYAEMMSIRAGAKGRRIPLPMNDVSKGVNVTQGRAKKRA